MSLDSQTCIKRPLKNGCFGKLAIPYQTTSLCLQQINSTKFFFLTVTVLTYLLTQ